MLLTLGKSGTSKVQNLLTDCPREIKFAFVKLEDFCKIWIAKKFVEKRLYGNLMTLIIHLGSLDSYVA